MTALRGPAVDPPAALRREAMRRRIRALLGPGGAASALFTGYEARAGQLAMAERIADAIDGDERLMVEAGTGTGKTLAYLVPALLSGRQGRRQHGHQDAAGPDRGRRPAPPARDVRSRRLAGGAAGVGRHEGPLELRVPAAPA
jgi:hypothetical protein